MPSRIAATAADMPLFYQSFNSYAQAIAVKTAAHGLRVSLLPEIWVLYFGVRISTRVQLALALISIIVVTVFFISVIVKLGSANSFKPFRPSSSADGWAGIFFGVLYGILLFTGFETSANLAEETPKPHRHIRAAVMSTAGIATIFFVLATYVEVAGFHYSLKTLGAAASAPLFALGA